MERKFKTDDPLAPDAAFNQELLENSIGVYAGSYFFATLFGGICAGLFQKWNHNFSQELAQTIEDEKEFDGDQDQSVTNPLDNDYD